VHRGALRETFAADGLTFRRLMFLVPGAELAGGLAVAVGGVTIPAALGLILLCLGAVRFGGLKRIPGMRPLNLADRAGDVLYLPEVLYILCLLPVLAFGPGTYSLDRLLAL